MSLPFFKLVLRFIIPIAIFICFCSVNAFAQKTDTVVYSHDTTEVIVKKNDSVIKKRLYVPRKAAIRSAILPGWGQVYNKKYWKLPIVYGALGVTAYIFFNNLSTYKELKTAYAVKYALSINPYNTAGIVPYPYAMPDSSAYFKLGPQFQVASLGSLRQNRDEFRKNIDYSVLVFILFWGLNVVDATVDAHLKGFDVSPDLSFKIRPYIAPTGNSFGISLVLKPKDKRHW
ncbi:MAG: DUF5683 domain-containing protein [Chitinophagaceae bacterium]